MYVPYSPHSGTPFGTSTFEWDEVRQLAYFHFSLAERQEARILNGSEADPIVLEPGPRFHRSSRFFVETPDPIRLRIAHSELG